ncbi:MAG TPA: type II secretion system protein [Magnetospirillaceae bacterium]|nr:type II secretion system protein [Magnetospirillaceae bacterium]
MKRNQGFTVLELIVAVVFLVIAGTFFFVQKRDLEIANRDNVRKTAINSIYYTLEDIYYPTNGGVYPEHLAADQLRGVDPAMLKDPNGKAFDAQGSDYTYTPKDCVDGKCRSYTLTANLENEADFVKTSRNGQ